MTMEQITAADPAAQSADLLADNLSQLKALFPELISESRVNGKTVATVNVDVLKALVGDWTVTDADEKYGLNWHGKRRARQLALTPSTGTLRPCPEESLDWDSTQNLMIEGDNLEVLKLLQKSYAGKVKLIYIDPPYNTGKDFVYPDDFRDNIGNYKRLTGQVDGEGIARSANTESSGRFHTDWLNMMYPRLKLARNLLREDGLLCISIDDTEQANVSKICNEIFGEENHVATIVWQKRYVSNVTAKWLSDMHDFILVYAKSREAVSVASWERTEEQLQAYRNPDNDPRGEWRAQDLSASKPYSAGLFTITGPTGLTFDPPPNRYWRCNEGQFNEWKRDNRIWWGVSNDARPMLKSFLAESVRGITPHTWWAHDFAGHNKEATLEVKELFDGDAPFDTPKPVRLMCRIIELFCDDSATVMDFFAGSGAFAHGAMKIQAKSNIRLRWINVQFPESTSRNDFPAITDITKERLRRVAARIKAAAVEKSPQLSFTPSPAPGGRGELDLGFRVFKLDTSNIRAWNPKPTDLEADLLSHQEHLIEGRSEADVLYELLLKLGLDLCVPIELRTIHGKDVHSVGGGVLMACLAPSISRDQVESLAQGIIAWRQALAPAGDTTCVFRDSAFSDDVAKTNLAAILEQHGIRNVRSL